jgi:hypothetical protein
VTKAIKSSTGAKNQTTWRNFFTAPALILRVTGIGITPRGKDAAQLSERAADSAAKAKTASTADIRDALDHRAARYAILAAQREVQEKRATQH